MKTTWLVALALAAPLCATLACGAPEPQPSTAKETAPAEPANRRPPNPLRDAYFGDLHVHTRYSFDAFVFGTHATPDDAYRYAKGEPIQACRRSLRCACGSRSTSSPSPTMREFLGAIASLEDRNGPLYYSPLGVEVRDADQVSERRALFRALAQRYRSGELQKQLEGAAPAVAAAWNDTIGAAERHYDPGRFTTFVGYEYTSAPDAQNLHRNVIFRGKASDLPFSSADSENPEDLWAWLDARRAEGIEALAIPHNSNGSNGQMFALASWAGRPLDAAYADRTRCATSRWSRSRRSRGPRTLIRCSRPTTSGRTSRSSPSASRPRSRASRAAATCARRCSTASSSKPGVPAIPGRSA